MSIGIGEDDYLLVIFGMLMFLSGALPKKIPLMNNLLYRVILFGGSSPKYAVNSVLQDFNFRLFNAGNITSGLGFTIYIPFVEFTHIKIFSFLPLLMLFGEYGAYQT